MEKARKSFYIADDELEAYAEKFAQSMGKTRSISGRAGAGQLKACLHKIEGAAEKAALQWQGLAATPGAVRWLLDNCYLARREAMAAAEALASVGKLRCTEDEALLLQLCRGFLKASDFSVEEDRLSLFLGGFQRVLMLGRDELERIPDALRWALTAELAEGCNELSGEGSGELEELFKNIFTCLHTLSSTDLSSAIERSDLSEQLLRRDPAGIYPLMDDESRGYYRRTLASLAKKRGVSEHELARQLLALAKRHEGEKAHVGHWLLKEPMGAKAKPRRGGLYISTLLLMSLFLSLLPAFAVKSIWAAVLLLLPVSELVKSLMDFVLLRFTPVTMLPRLELKDGVPEEGCTLCAISCILDSENSARALLRRLEQHRLCSRDCGSGLLFALIADLPDTKEAEYPGSDGILAAARSVTEELNAGYGGGFFLLTRPRTKNKEGRYMGWERKRGAILETMALIKGRESSMECISGELDRLKNARFLLTLDSDTRIEPGSARGLIGAMLHPLNRPHMDSRKKLVVSGHGIIAPRMSLYLPSAVKSDFSKLFGGQGGCDPYSGSCGELYMDLWQRGGFGGKGIIDIDSCLSCMDGRIPENSVLSHDAIEGAFLRSAFMGNCQFTDSFPATALSYYKRQHRWIRGDWQNLPWLFARGKELPDIERFRLFDSLRRSLVPVMSFVSIYAGFFLPPSGFLIAALAALLACASRLVITTAQSLLRSEEEARLRFHSGIIHGFGGSLAGTVIYLILLPIEACNSLDAILRALWRLLISRKNMLQWQTAGQSDAQRSNFFGYVRSMWMASALGLAALLFSPAILGRAVGLIWLLSPLCAYILGVSAADSPTLSSAGQDYLLKSTEEMWSYFETFLSEKDHFLPPDNFQAQPPNGLARRTSPTNIGLALLSCLSALELGLTDKNRAMYLIENCLDSLEKLEKWQGQFLNWYSTETLRPLTPRFVSTVDSGNFYACLAALEVALTEHDRPDLAARVHQLLSAMDFRPLYDRKRQLFHTGYDLEKAELSRSWYDLMSSEARLTAYIAIAKGDVPRRHWQRLSRAMVQKNAYRGMVSWTGTMFEYLMPELLLPLYKDSLLYESSRFCLYVQKHRAASCGVWGCSESAFYSLDSSMNYRYKAHGCAALALKRGMDDECVISPYSSFLALVLSPAEAVRNLRRLEALGMKGRFGFWEALDCTAGREGTVRCVMAHHLGMSICAAANCLSQNVWQKRFMSRPEMSAYETLLQEKIPLGGKVLRRKGGENPRPVRQDFTELWDKSGSGTDFLQPQCCRLASMSYSLMFSESGLSRPLWGAISPYVPAEDPLDCRHGLDFFLSCRGRTLSLLPESRSSEGRFFWRFSPEMAEISREDDDFSSKLSVFIPENATGERRVLQIKNGAEPMTAQLSLRFCPLLARNADYLAQPSFWKLGISFKRKNNCLIVRRLARNGSGELFLCLAADREGIFESCPPIDSGRFGDTRVIGEEEYFPAALELSWRCPLDLPPGGNFSCRFSLAMGHSEDEAMESAIEALGTAPHEAASLPRRAASILGMNGHKLGMAWELLTALEFPPAAKVREDCRQSRLWAAGISGDLPIVCADFSDEALLPRAEELMDSHLLICACGGDFDLVFISRDSTGYRKPLNDALQELLWKNGGELLSGAKGGVHILPPGDAADAAVNCAAAIIDLSRSHSERERNTELRHKLYPQKRLPSAKEDIRYRWEEDGSFTFAMQRSLPERVWSNVLTNGRFGYLACDSGCGNMWFLNSREMQINLWQGQDSAVEGSETLLLETDSGNYSLFAAADGNSARLSYSFGSAVWEKRFGMGKSRVTAFVPPETDCRVFIIECEGLESACLRWQLALSMGGERYVDTAFHEGLFTARSSRWRGRDFLACTSAPAPDVSLEENGKAVFSARIKAAGCAVIVCGCCGEDELRALCMPEKARSALADCRVFWRSRCGYLKTETPSAELDRIMNGWAAYQALACRSMARCGLYQAGGAFGFRDQLQDSVNLIDMDSSIARRQILRCCTRQYLEGDVQHWWHEGTGEIRGVRTHCSDDLLWLPWALCEYTEKTGDDELWRQRAEYISSPPLSENDKDRYETGEPSGISESVIEHCCRAMDAVLRRGIGESGLLLIGSGDWNDGLDNVHGESLWLTWFFISTALRFDSLLRKLLPGESYPYADAARALALSANRAWDGDWFIRARFADGKAIGSRDSDECIIDSIAQSFAVFCPLADSKKAEKAVMNAYKLLYDSKHSLVKLFTPPFEGKSCHPGYIESYGPGFRENGGQYTHAAIWLIMALLHIDRREEAWTLLKAILPSGRDIGRYKAEPYVIAADVWAAPGHEGEAGWTWYTGSAGWLLRVVSEELFGIKLREGRLYIKPRLPEELGSCRLDWHGHSIEYCLGSVRFDGQDYNGGGIEPEAEY